MALFDIDSIEGRLLEVDQNASMPVSTSFFLFLKYDYESVPGEKRNTLFIMVDKVTYYAIVTD